MESEGKPSALKYASKSDDIYLVEGRGMTEKVWGIVLIVVAVLSILWGINNYRETALVEKITNSYIGSDRNSRSLFRNEKAYSIAWLGGGIILAAIGTMILSKARPNRYIVHIEGEEDLGGDCMDPPDIEKDTSGKWKF